LPESRACAADGIISLQSIWSRGRAGSLAQPAARWLRNKSLTRLLKARIGWRDLRYNQAKAITLRD
jgi:hypothetical protein